MSWQNGLSMCFSAGTCQSLILSDACYLSCRWSCLLFKSLFCFFVLVITIQWHSFRSFFLTAAPLHARISFPLFLSLYCWAEIPPPDSMLLTLGPVAEILMFPAPRCLSAKCLQLPTDGGPMGCMLATCSVTEIRSIAWLITFFILSTCLYLTSETN